MRNSGDHSNHGNYHIKHHHAGLDDDDGQSGDPDASMQLYNLSTERRRIHCPIQGASFDRWHIAANLCVRHNAVYWPEAIN